jgi:hypothetical protein
MAFFLEGACKPPPSQFSTPVHTNLLPLNSPLQSISTSSHSPPQSIPMTKLSGFLSLTQPAANPQPVVLAQIGYWCVHLLISRIGIISTLTYCHQHGFELHHLMRCHPAVTHRARNLQLRSENLAAESSKTTTTATPERGFGPAVSKYVHRFPGFAFS